MWDVIYRLGAVLTATAWIAALVLLVAGVLLDNLHFDHAAVVAAVAGGMLYVTRDNTKTRKMMRVALARFETGSPGSSDRPRSL